MNTLKSRFHSLVNFDTAVEFAAAFIIAASSFALLHAFGAGLYSGSGPWLLVG